MKKLSIGFSELIRQSRFSTSVDFSKGFMRKYWSMRRETLTVRCLSTTVRETNRPQFRNEIRAFLYKTPEELFDLIVDIKSDYTAVKERILDKMANEEPLTEEEQKDFKLDYKISVQVRAYEKEFFYLKCLALHQARGTPDNPIKPQFVLRALAKLSTYRKIDEVFTAPELLFALFYFRECEDPVWKKDIKILS